MRVAVSAEEVGYDPEKEELVVPTMPKFNGKERGSNQGIKRKRHAETVTW